MSSEMRKLWSDPEFLKSIRPPSKNGAVTTQAATGVNGDRPRHEEVPLISSTRTGYPSPQPPAADTVPQPTHGSDTGEVTRPVHTNGNGKRSESAKVGQPVPNGAKISRYVHPGDGEVVRNLELVRFRIEQPVADLAILLGAMELGEGQCGDQQKEQFHGSFLPVILTGS